MHLSEKTLLLAAKHGNSNSGFLVGSFFPEPGVKSIYLEKS